jgi:hypothetical protein
MDFMQKKGKKERKRDKWKEKQTGRKKWILCNKNKSEWFHNKRGKSP